MMWSWCAGNFAIVLTPLLLVSLSLSQSVSCFTADIGQVWVGDERAGKNAHTTMPCVRPFHTLLGLCVFFFLSFKYPHVVVGVIGFCGRSPSGIPGGPARALLFDSWFDEYRGVICLMSVKDGTLRKGNPFSFEICHFFGYFCNGTPSSDSLDFPSPPLFQEIGLSAKGLGSSMTFLTLGLCSLDSCCPRPNCLAPPLFIPSVQCCGCGEEISPQRLVC